MTPGDIVGVILGSATMIYSGVFLWRAVFGFGSKNTITLDIQLGRQLMTLTPDKVEYLTQKAKEAAVWIELWAPWYDDQERSDENAMTQDVRESADTEEQSTDAEQKYLEHQRDYA